MEKSDTHTHSSSRLLRDVEDIALELDGAIESGEIDPAHYSKLKSRFSALSNPIGDVPLEVDSRFFIFDEALALFLWIDKDKEGAMGKIADSVAKKGDKQLASKAGRGLAASLPGKTSTTVTARPGPLSSWLGLFFMTTLFILACSLLAALAMTFTIALEPTLQGFLTLIFFYVCTSLAAMYVVYVSKASRHAIKTAIMLYTLLSVTFAGIGVSMSISGSSTAELGFVIFLVLCGILTTLYYARSKRVKRAFVG